MTFKEKIVKLRKMKGLTQDDFASAVGVSRQAVYKWECGQSYPEVAKLLEIKMLFGISIDDLLDESYEVIVPEKKKRRRSKAQAQTAEAMPTFTPTVAAPVKEEAPAPAPVVEEPKAEAPKAEAPKKAEPAPAAEENVSAEDAFLAGLSPERRSLFSKLFSKK